MTNCSINDVIDTVKSKCTNLCLFAPHVQILALSFGEMVPCLLFGSSLEYRHNLFNCGRMQGRTSDHPKTEREREKERKRERTVGKEQRSEKAESTRDVKNCVCVCSFSGICMRVFYLPADASASSYGRVIR